VICHYTPDRFANFPRIFIHFLIESANMRSLLLAYPYLLDNFSVKHAPGNYQRNFQIFTSAPVESKR